MRPLPESPETTPLSVKLCFADDHDARDVCIRNLDSDRSRSRCVARKSWCRETTEADFANFKEGTFEVRETAEEALVGKTARAVEEVRIGKESTVHEETVRDTVRKTQWMSKGRTLMVRNPKAVAKRLIDPMPRVVAWGNDFGYEMHARLLFARSLSPAVRLVGPCTGHCSKVPCL